MIKYKVGNADFTGSNLKKLFDSVGWYQNKGDISDRYLKAVNNSDFVVSAWDGSRLVGLCTCLDDGLSVYIVWLLVHKEYHFCGIGRELIELVKNKYKDCELMVQTYTAKGFYSKCGFEDDNCISLVIDGVNPLKVEEGS